MGKTTRGAQTLTRPDGHVVPLNWELAEYTEKRVLLGGKKVRGQVLRNAL
jgi:hypothetical protein